MRKTTKYRRFELAAKEDEMAVHQAERLLAQVPGKNYRGVKFHVLPVCQTASWHPTAVLCCGEPIMPQAISVQKTSRVGYINRMKSDQKLARSLRDHIQDPVLVLGDLSASNARYHEPIRGKGMRKMFVETSWIFGLFDQ
jgi:hypothetical protein